MFVPFYGETGTRTHIAPHPTKYFLIRGNTLNKDHFPNILTLMLLLEIPPAKAPKTHEKSPAEKTAIIHRNPCLASKIIFMILQKT